VSKFNYSKNTQSNKSNSFNYPVSDSVYDFDYPIFCFKHLNKKFSLNKCDAKHKKALITRLGKLSELGFDEINKSGRHQFGREKINKKSLKFNLPKFITDDVDFLYAFRYNGKHPFLAYRRPNSAILHIIAIDYNFSAYNHGGS